MNADDVGGFLSRWSRRKLENVKDKATPPAPAPEAGTPAPDAAADAAQRSADPAAQAAPPEPLPPVESLTPASDFKPFMAPGVDPGVKQAALKQLFRDPQFNVMDGLDTYIDDYTVADPIPEAMMKTLYQAREHLFSPEQKAAAIAEENAAAEAAAAEAAAADAKAEAQAEELAAEFAKPNPLAPDPKDA